MTYKQKIRHREKIREIKTQAGRVRQAARILRSFTFTDLADLCHPDPEKAIRSTIGDLRKTGEVMAIGRGVYQFGKKDRPRNYNDIIWHLVRSHRAFTTDEIERLSGASRATVNEYLQYLAGSGILEKVGRSGYRLIRDPGPATPINTTKREKLARIRERRRTHAR